MIKTIIGNLIDAYNVDMDLNEHEHACNINRSVIKNIIGTLQEIIFPYHFGKKRIKKEFFEYHIGELVEEVMFSLNREIENGLNQCRPSGCCTGNKIKEEANALTIEFLSKLGEVRKILLTDVDAAFNGDPAASSMDEIISTYPGIFAIMVYRLANVLYKLKIPLIPRIMTEYAHGATGIDINPGAAIGHHFFIDHGTGIVIGETTIIGSHAKIYQGVTLGGLSTKGGQSLKNIKRHPTIEDNVTIYSGASILGGDTVIGHDTVIGSNAFITKSVAPYTRISIRNHEMQTKNIFTDTDSAEFWDYQI